MSRALVISGGGSKGAFVVGVLKRLFAEYPALDFDIYVGTSTGSLMSPLVALIGALIPVSTPVAQVPKSVMCLPLAR